MMGKWHNINWLLVAGLATLAYALIVLHWIGLDRISIYPTNNSLNEVGDFIAGFFAPLAVIWLICAVFTQRQELVDTRDQFKKNQESINEQMAEIKEQSAFLLKQHKLAEETAKKTYRLSLFEERYKLYSDFVSLGERHKNTHFGKAYWEMVELSARARFVFSNEIQAWFEAIENEILSLNEDRRQSLIEEYDSAGNHRWVFKNDEDKRRCDDLEQWLVEQFTNVADRSEKFEKSMTISDD
ncbi:hypothetical protein [Agrobacterium pusense]|uniref:hypothetical protein n=1 Tax=Agrobacterium pusense TaxID=648995 RepID=UPI0021CF4C6C|nr:hypothetical protein [Agrobacterium pusense]UXT89292.1 hypothetical protein FY130_05850 [Agrobacterium pusense]